MERAMAVLASNNYELDVVRDEPSRTEGHRHVVLRADHPLDIYERIALQACLGSDLKRELLALLRVWQGITPITVFFEEE
jgi:hypothetical protein